MNAMAAALAKVCRERLLEEKWLIAPSLRVGHQWLEAVARGGQPALNARVKTLLHMALDLAGPALALEGRRLLSALDGEMLVGRIWPRLASGAAAGYLLALEPSTGLLQRVFASIRDLRLAGLGADDLRPDDFEDGTKGKELAALLHACVEELRRSGWVDHADVFRLATGRLRDEPAALGRDVLVLVPRDAELTRLERELVDALAAERLIRLPVDDASSASVLGGDGSARILRAVGEANEVRAALRRLLAEGLALDDVELLHTEAETYVPLVYELVTGLTHGDSEGSLPVTFAEGIPARTTRPGRALMAWLAWQRDDYPQATLVRMIQDGLLRAADAESSFGFARLANLLRPIPIGIRRGRYLSAIDERLAALARQSERRAGLTDEDGERHERPRAALDERLAGTRLVRSLVADLLAVTPEAGASQAELLGAAEAFLARFARCAGEDDEYARRRLLEEIEALAAWVRDAEGLPYLDVAQWLAELPKRARIKGSGPRPGCLHVASVASGGHSGRPHTFIVGLDDSRFPGSGTQDPVLLDGERRRLSKELPTAAGRLQEKLTRFARLLARLRGKVTLSFSCRSLDDDREMFASPVVLAAFRILAGQPEGDHAALDAWLSPPASFAPDAPDGCLDDADWWLWRLCGAETIGNTVEVLQGNFPRLHRGLGTAVHRGATQLTPYDGLVPQAGRDLDPTAPDGPVVSASRLQNLAACPLRYFFRYVLELEPPEELAIDPTRWLDPLASGSLLHEVFCEFMRELRDAGRLPELERDWPRLSEILGASVERYLAAYPPPSQLVFQHQRRELERTAQTFLREEETFCRTSQPLYFEAAIGMRPDAHGTPLDTAEPVALRLPNGATMRARGRIDRVDRVGEACQQTFAVWDYKTGGTTRFERADPFRQGRVVQNILSLLLTEARLKAELSPDARVERFGYFFPGVRAHGERIAWTPGELAAGGDVLARLCEIAASGCFLATNNADDCRYCDYVPICGDVDALAAASQAKLDEPANTILKPFRELRSQ